MFDAPQGGFAFVTAAGQGIGRAIAEEFIAEGATVIATDLVEDSLNGLQTANTSALDVRSTNAVRELASKV